MDPDPGWAQKKARPGNFLMALLTSRKTQPK